jgi:hypothetical protein
MKPPRQTVAETSKKNFVKPPTLTSQSNGAAQNIHQPINYNALEKNNAWLNKHALEIKDVFGLEFSNTFEQMEQLVKDKCDLEQEEDKAILSDLNRKQSQPNRPTKNNEQTASIQKPNYFDCDVSEIPANRYCHVTRNNKTGISEDSKLGTFLNHQLSKEQ